MLRKIVFKMGFCSLLVLHGAHAQQQLTAKEADILERSLNDAYGEEKLNVLTRLTSYFVVHDLRKAIRYGKAAVVLSDNIYGEGITVKKADPGNQQFEAYFLMGRAYYSDQKYYNAQQFFRQARAMANNAVFGEGVVQADRYLQKLDSISETQGGIKSNIFSRSIQNLELGEKIHEASVDISIATKIKAAENHKKRGEFDAAKQELADVINMLRNLGDEERIEEIKAEMENIELLASNAQNVLKYYESAIKEQERLADSLTRNLKPQTDTSSTISSKAQPDPDADAAGPEGRDLDESVDVLSEIQSNYAELAETYLQKKDYERAMQYSTLAQQYESEIQKRELVETELLMLRQQKQIAELDLRNKESELERQSKARNNLFVGSGLLLALVTALSMLYVTKQRDHKRLTVAYRDLDETKGMLELAETRIKKLLGQQLSTDIARELISAQSEARVQRKFACIMFLDIRGFTAFAEEREPEEIVQYQNEIFSIMIRVVHEYHGLIHQFLGDGFMAVFGIPESRGNDCQHAMDASMAIVREVATASSQGIIPDTRIGIGLHAGYVVAGNVGTESRMQYSITGNAVILAARLEQLNKKYNTQLIISEEVYDELDDFEGEAAFDEVFVKGRREPVKILKVV